MHLGWGEIVAGLGVILLLFGPKRLPGLGSSLGTAIRGFRRSLSGQEEGDTDPSKMLPSNKHEDKT